MIAASTLIGPNILDQVKSLEWIARILAKGLILGKHQSSNLGTGMEFTQYRPYSQGDDLRLLDWKMYARTNKYFIRQSNINTNHNLSLYIDNSLSMNYSENDVSKLDIAKIITSALTLIMAKQGDEFLWYTDHDYFPPSSGLKHWNYSTLSLFNLKTSRSVSNSIKISKSRSVNVWITDLYDDLEQIEKTINSLIGTGNELVLIHLIGKSEEKMDFPRNATFLDLETGETIQSDSSQYAQRYFEKIGQHFLQVIRICQNKKVIYQKIYLQSDLAKELRIFIDQYNYLNAL